MTIYWRIGQLIIGIYIVIQALIFTINRLPVNAESIQSTAQTLLNAHLQQRLPEYYYKVSQTTEVWASIPSLPTASQGNLLIDTLFPGKTVTVLDSALLSSELTDFHWLKVAFEGTDHINHTGWIIAQNQ
uniref:Uncharacterized protein n=1 Tax=Roseihalotalea indica TaxID=2867963 RepID=A0AA49JEG4_9BACT|nr:hypothetical protein K4G66_17665 [Tunicatimonas sp. TK19036]